MPIPGKHAQIHWSTKEVDGRRLVAEVVVFDNSRPWKDREDLQCSGGACSLDWMEGSDLRSTPEGQYAHWLADGFASADAHLVALEQLGEIEECAWANDIAVVLRGILHPE